MYSVKESTNLKPTNTFSILAFWRFLCIRSQKQPNHEWHFRHFQISAFEHLPKCTPREQVYAFMAFYQLIILRTVGQCPGWFLGIIGGYSGVSKSKQLHVAIFWCFFLC